MWKFVTRGIRESLERRASCRTNVYSQTSDGSNSQSEVKSDLAKNKKLLAPAVTNYNNGFFGSAKTGGPKDKKNETKWDTGRSWSDAVGWSSVLAVGWVVCQSLCLRKRLFERSAEEAWHKRLPLFQGISVSPSLVGVFNVHHHILPVTHCVANQHNSNHLEQQWTEPTTYGPITVEEALKEAKDNYTRTHRVVMGEFELRYGVRALEEKRYKDAVKHFATGASLSSSGSMFNLGICYEMGIGIATDIKMAAKYYSDAADRGHPDAMYNLGVFHAQGRGGLPLDISRARALFTEAANRGQTQAQVALEMEKKAPNEEDLESRNREQQLRFRQTDKIQKKHPTKTLLEMAGLEDSSTENSGTSSKSEASYFEESVQNSTEAFLSSLGLNMNPVPIIVGPGDPNVPYYD